MVKLRSTAKAAKVAGESDLARHLVEEIVRTNGSPPVYTQGRFYLYDRGVWRAWDETLLRQRLQGYHRKVVKVTSYLVDATVKLLQSLLYDPEFFSATNLPLGLCCSDGFAAVSPQGVVLQSHSAGTRTRYSFEGVYTPTREPEAFLEFLSEVWRDDVDKSDKIESLGQFVGACLLGAAPLFEQAVLLYGRDGQNGKSVLIAALERLFAGGSKVSVPPQKWGEEYYLAELIDARMNLVGEIPKSELVEGAVFKAVISGDAVTGRPIRSAPVKFRPVAGHIFACNILPAVSDVGNAFWRRWLILDFNRVFDGKRNKTELVDTISADTAAIASWALRCFSRALANGAYTVPTCSGAVKARWSERADQVRAWLNECVIEDKVAEVSTREAYDCYRSWALSSGHSRLSKSAFRDRLLLLGHNCKRGSKGESFNFSLRDDEDWGKKGLVQVL